ncbi:Clp protease ClpP [Pseudoflavonifractor capillosus]|uniref:head maturation protease, ClpP-related n=1 Tax=Pseudoflavonifractor capillosus TaxID=106588 RepID=UPI00195CA55E|nr:head maturation protease, ClpP-related [Pseudoflavonifractor capillosus]MBM6897757.1 Clp protease ClpP [Pseudoflavonifractor capillosus]
MKDPKKTRPAAVDIRRPVYAMATTDGQSAEITMYGDIYEQRPTDWFGNPVEGEFVLLSDFMEDLEQIASCKEITIRMNSYGGDAGVSITIHNRLRELARAGATLTCIVDGVAMSGGSLIMCACDTVKVNPSSLVMIHKCWTFIFGGYNADEMRELAARNDTWDKAQISIYKRKTGMSDTVLSHMMSDTTYMTGGEAMEKGFADELLEDAEPLGISASADGRCLFVHGRALHLASGMFAPDNIPTVNQETKATISAMGQVYSAAIPATVRQAATRIAEDDAVQRERKRLQDIDALESQFDAETIQAAKYGPDACTAQEMAYRAAQKAAKTGKSYLASMMSDTEDSGAQDVGAASASGEPAGGGLTPEQRMAKGRADAKALKEGKK